MKAELSQLKANLLELYRELRAERREKFERSTSFGDYFGDRWDRAAFEGFGEGSTVYDNVLILGDVKAGKNVWVGPNVVLDGSGGLEIGDYCSISAGVQVYTHHTVEWSTSLGAAPIPRKSTKIGHGVYIGPNTVIQMGVTIGDGAVIGACSFVNRDIPAGAKAFGSPARVHGANVEQLISMPDEIIGWR